MIFKAMNVSALVQLFRQELIQIYPQREVEQIIALVFEEVLNYSRVDIVLNSDEVPDDGRLIAMQAALDRLKNSEPVQYVLGKTVFYGLPFRVNKDVLIPRQETEELIHWILKDQFPERPTVIDLGTGSGCIPIVLKDLWPAAKVFGADISIDALNVANQNAAQNGVEVEFFHFDIIERESLAFMKFDLMVSNPPYVRRSERNLMEQNVLGFEPEMALFVDDSDPLIFYRKIVDLAEGHLNKGGKLYFEINEAYGAELKQLMKDRGFGNVELKKDFNGKDRMMRGVWN
ncbi:MAG: peptide chain release factor N(5)-glutamine methyltransferase [Flavobacteriales bacterium]|nr:peptide chain release factor N(5)-glutamine methyltransferase [Flavobacteriales bacterium]